MVCGLSVGLSLQDMRSMRMTDVANIVSEYTAMQPEPKKDEDEVRDATQADIEYLKGL